MFRSSRRPLAAFLVLAAGVGCRGATAPTGQLAELLGARVPATAAPGEALEVAGYFGRGACERTRPVVERSGATLSLALVREVPDSPGPCIGVLLPDTVVARVPAPVPLPLTVRFRRAGAADSVVVVRGP